MSVSLRLLYIFLGILDFSALISADKKKIPTAWTLAKGSGNGGALKVRKVL